MSRLIAVFIAIVAVVGAGVAGVQAKQRHYGLICGLTQRLHFHKTDKSLNLALEWARKFPHTYAKPEAVVVQWRHGRALGGGQGGHVSRIVRPIDQCHAIVIDEKGQYERDICKRLVAIVDPTG